MLKCVVFPFFCQVPQDPDVVLAPQRNGCRVEIHGGVAHATPQVCYFSNTVFTFTLEE